MMVINWITQPLSSSRLGYAFILMLLFIMPPVASKMKKAFVIWIFLCCGDLTNTRASDAERHNDLNLTGGTFSIRLSNGTTARQGRTLLLAAGLLHRFYDRLFGNFEQQPPIIINNNNNNDLQGGNSNMDRGYNTQGMRYNNPEEERAF